MTCHPSNPSLVSIINRYFRLRDVISNSPFHPNDAKSFKIFVAHFLLRILSNLFLIIHFYPSNYGEASQATGFLCVLLCAVWDPPSKLENHLNGGGETCTYQFRYENELAVYPDE